MKRFALAITLALALTATTRLHAQAIYGEFTADKLPGGPQGDFLYGGTAGAMLDITHFGKHVYMSGDMRGTFVQRSGELFDAVTIGPRFTFPFTRDHGFVPYASFQIGFARYSDAKVHGTTNDIYGGNAGVTKRLNKHFDAVVDFSYEPYGAFYGQYNTQAYSAGVIYYIHKR